MPSRGSARIASGSRWLMVTMHSTSGGRSRSCRSSGSRRPRQRISNGMRCRRASLRNRPGRSRRRSRGSQPRSLVLSKTATTLCAGRSAERQAAASSLFIPTKTISNVTSATPGSGVVTFASWFGKLVPVLAIGQWRDAWATASSLGRNRFRPIHHGPGALRPSPRRRRPARPSPPGLALGCRHRVSRPLVPDCACSLAGRQLRQRGASLAHVRCEALLRAASLR